MLTEKLDCLFIDNLVYSFSDNLPFGFWLSRKMFGNRGHQSFKSDYGNTRSLHSPSECGAFWYRWFPRTHDFVNKSDISQSAIEEMRLNLHMIMEHFQQSIIIKNLNAGQRIRVLQDAFPNAKFVFIRRSPFFTIQSLLKARIAQKMPDERWWSVKPDCFKDLQEKPLIEKLTGQVFHLEAQIIKDTTSMPKDKVRRIRYCELSEEFESLVEFLALPIRNGVQLGEFNFVNKVSVDAPTKEKIESAMSLYDWSEVGYDR